MAHATYIGVVGNALNQLVLKKVRFIILIFAFLTTGVVEAVSQNIKKCDGTVVLSTKNAIGQLTREEVSDFLLTFGKECINNIEYSEFSNEVLFALLEEHTDLTLTTMEGMGKEIEIDVLLKEIASPLHDLIDIKGILEKVETAKVSKHFKSKVVEQLKVAEEAIH